MAKQKADWRDRRLGQRIEEARERASLTRQQVGDVFGLTSVQIYKYEKGANRISAIDLDVISRLTKTPVAEFLAAIDNESHVQGGNLAEPMQASFVEADVFQGLANVVAQHIREHFNEDYQRDFAAAVETLRHELKDVGKPRRKRVRSVKRTGSANQVDRPE